MTQTAAPAATYVLLVSRLGIDAGAHQCRTITGARRKFAALRDAGTADQGAIVIDQATPPGAYPEAPVEYLGRT